MLKRIFAPYRAGRSREEKFKEEMPSIDGELERTLIYRTA
jgi:hypothetical protein